MYYLHISAIINRVILKKTLDANSRMKDHFTDIMVRVE